MLRKIISVLIFKIPLQVIAIFDNISHNTKLEGISSILEIIKEP